MNNQKFDIIIIGSSFAGMTCALMMAQISPQISIALIEKNNIFNQTRAEDGRAYAISSASLKVFQELAILDELEKIAGKIADIKITDYKSPIILDFIGAEFDKINHQFGAIIENHFIFEALKNRLKLQKNIQIFCPNFYQEINFNADNPHKTSVKLDDNQVLHAKLLLGCDGRFSKLRELYKIPTLTKDYHQTAIVFKISHQLPHQNIAHEKFLPQGPLAILPLKNPHQSSIVWIVKEQLAPTILKLDNANFLQQFHKTLNNGRNENILGNCEIISAKFSYPLIMVLAEKFYHHQMLFIGDSACGVHPIAGQGFNLAIANMVILRDLIAQQILNGLEINSSLLIDNYHRKARANSKKMVIATDILNSIFDNNISTLKFLRNTGLAMVNNLAPLKKFFIKNAGGIE